jgi:hypothetical protein
MSQDEIVLDGVFERFARSTGPLDWSRRVPSGARDVSRDGDFRLNRHYRPGTHIAGTDWIGRQNGGRETIEFVEIQHCPPALSLSSKAVTRRLVRTVIAFAGRRRL